MIHIHKIHITIILLLLCIFISLAFQYFGNNLLEGLDNKSNEDDYINDVIDRLNQIENIIQDSCTNPSQLPQQQKIQKIKDIVSDMKESDSFTYKTDLQNILNDDNNDNSNLDLFQNLLNKIKDQRVQIKKDMLNARNAKLKNQVSAAQETGKNTGDLDPIKNTKK